MQSQSEEVKSNSGTSESERENLRQKLSSYKYETMPKRDNKYRQQKQENSKITITTNLFEINLLMITINLLYSV